MEYVNGITRVLAAYDSGNLPSYIFLNQTHRARVCRGIVWPPGVFYPKVTLLSHSLLMQTSERGSARAYTLCTMSGRIPCSNIWIVSNQAVARNDHYPVFRSSDYEISPPYTGSLALDIRAQPQRMEVLCNCT